MSEIASALKVAYHRDKLQAYLRGERIFPATLELDLTTVCNRNCPHCASTTYLPADYLELDFVDRLFSIVQGQTRGLLLTGGEPTMAPCFPDVLRLARQRDFLEVAVVTNGSLLGHETVADALLTSASTVRLSLYDWTAGPRDGLHAALRRIEALRTRIDQERSRLQIGVSVLTSEENADELAEVVRATSSAGAHWVYFHPFCTRWDAGTPTKVSQNRVLAAIAACQSQHTNGFGVHVCSERYADAALEFEGYHAAHFLLVVGADGMNYLGPEVKYHARHVMADLSREWRDDFLWKEERLARIQSVSSRTYPAMGSRHRGALYSDLIEDMRRRVSPDRAWPALVSNREFLFPHIL